MLNTVWQFATAGTLKFGRGARKLVVEHLQRSGLRRPLLVTDRVVAATPIAAEWIAELQRHVALQVFDQGTAEPAIEVAERAAEAGREGRIDAVIGLGGGSNLDVAKVVATVIQHGGRPQDYFGFDRIPSAILPLIALPTTAGTGSEVSHSAVLTDPQQGVKVSTLSHWLRPAAAVVDPDLSDSCPPRVTAHSGIDALVHAVEAYTNRDYSQMVGVDPQARAYEGSYALTRLLAGEAIRLIGRGLQRACADHLDSAARDDMALAATLAGMAFSNSGVAIVHALEYPVGALTHCGHGEGNGLLLPHVMRFNLPARVAEFAEIARWLGAASADEPAELAAPRAVAAVERLLDAIGIRRQLRELGLAHSDIPQVADKAFAIKRLMDVNPRTPSRSDLLQILESAW